MDVEVREAQSDEVSTACAVWTRAEAARTGREPLSAEAEQFVQEMREAVDRPGAKLLVGAIDGEVVATIYGVPLRNNRAKAQVAMLAVEPNLWGRGLGTKMLDALMRVLAEHGCTHLRMNVDPANERAQGLYERQGWRHEGETERLDDTVELIYRIDLETSPGS